MIPRDKLGPGWFTVLKASQADFNPSRPFLHHESLTKVYEKTQPIQTIYKQSGCVLLRGVLGEDELRHDTFDNALTSQVESEDNRLSCEDGIPEGDILKRYPRFVQPHRRPEVECGRLADSRLYSDGTKVFGHLILHFVWEFGWEDFLLGLQPRHHLDIAHSQMHW